MSAIAPTNTIPPIRIAPAIQPSPRIIPSETTPTHHGATSALNLKA